MAKKLLCVLLITAIALAVGIMSGIAEAQPHYNVCDYKTCRSDGECGSGFHCCEIGSCGAGTGICCNFR
ncbi:hypothetical protein SUGI_0847080 [Cryptomeria japonica]|nr:hypothetical protein SUGI_0847080 [Cryptomeria japonica]